MATTEEDDENRSMKLNPALDVDLDEIDDKEFDIPRVDKPPTLESILNAPDDDLPIADNCIVDGTMQVGATPTILLRTHMHLLIPIANHRPFVFTDLLQHHKFTKSTRSYCALLLCYMAQIAILFRECL